MAKRYVPDPALLVGASWYPEMWPEEEWGKDIARMKELGYTIVRLFEFAWHRFEPAEGAYDFDWALRLLDQLHEAGIRVMIGTPTAAPPAWLTEAYPDVLLTSAEGRRARHGTRKHGSHVSKTYRRLCAGIVGKMCEAFGTHPAVHSWQIDNEMSGSDYGAEATTAFHAWLKKTYGTVEAMNAAWGLEFWSQAYSRFEQVPMVTASVGSIEVPERNHPSLIMAIARFQNDEWNAYIKNQCDVIRKVSDKPITSNMTPTWGMHWFQHNRGLDRVGASIYKDVDHYDWTISTFDRMRAEKQAPYWLLETAPSWSAGGRIWNIHHDAKGLQAITWLSVALGGSMVLYWQWRQHWAGQEMLHGTLVTATGTWRPNKEAHQAICAAANDPAIGGWLMANPPQAAEMAVMIGNEAAWSISIDPYDDKVRYEPYWRDHFYLPLVQEQIYRDVIDETQDFSRYKLIILPMMPLLKEKTRQRLAEWVRGGGHLLLGPLTGHRTEEHTAWTDREFGGLEEIMGATSSIRFTPHWVDKRIQVAFDDGRQCHPSLWCEGFESHGAEVLARYDGGYGHGHAAVMDNHIGNGSVITCGTVLDRDVYLSLVHALMERAGLERLAGAGEKVVVVPRGTPTGRRTGYAVINTSEEPQPLTLLEEGTNLFTGAAVPMKGKLQPLEVLFVKTK